MNKLNWHLNNLEKTIIKNTKIKAENDKGKDRKVKHYKILFLSKRSIKDRDMKQNNE